MNPRRSLMLTVALATVSVTAAAQTVRYEGALGMATGTYIFAERTTAWSLYSGLSLSSGPVVVRAGLPVYLQNSTLIAGSGVGTIPTGGSSSGVVADTGRARKGMTTDTGGTGGGGGGPGGGMGPGTGMSASLTAADGPVNVPGSASTSYRAAVGDPTAQIGLRVVDSRSISLMVSGLLKAPLADTATFGTGQWDVGAGASLSSAVGRTTQLSLDLTWWRMGDMPDLELRNPVGGSLSLATLVGGRWSVGLTASANSPILDGYQAPVMVGGSVARLGRGAVFGLTGSVGLTSTAPDLSLGLMWGISVGQLLGVH